MMKYFVFLSLLLTTFTALSQDSLGYYNSNISNNFKSKNFNKSDELFNEKLNYLTNIKNLEEYYYAHFDYYLLDNSLERIHFLKPTNSWRNATTNKEKIAYLHLIINNGYHFSKYGFISKSVDYYEQALHYYQENNLFEYDIISYCLQPLGNNYTRLGDYAQAEEIFKYTLQLAEKKENNSALIATYQNLSIKYQSINKQKEAIEIIEKALQIKPITFNQKSILYSLMAKNYYEQNDYSKALNLIDISNRYNNNLKTTQKNELTKGLCYFKTEKFNLAKKTLLKAVKKSEKIYGFNNRETIKIYNLLANVDVKLKQPQKALANYQKSLQLLLPNYHPKNMLEDNPTKNDLFAENTIKETLDAKANLLVHIGKPLQAIRNYQLAFEVEKMLQKTYTSQKSKLLQQTEIRDRTEKIVDLFYELFQETRKQDYINSAFITVENSKAMILQDVLNSNYLKRNLTTDPLIIKEKLLLQKKSVLLKNKKLEELKIDKANVSVLKDLNVRLTTINTRLQVLKQKILLKYPFFKSTNNSLSITDIQDELLQKEHLLISFLDTKTAVFIFSLRKDHNISLRKFQKTSHFNASLKEYINLFSDGHDAKIKKDIDHYKANALKLYQQLLAPEIINLSINKLTLIPDGILNFVAFDALITSKTKHTNFSKLPYLLFKHQINYGYSVKVLQQQLKSLPTKRKKIVGFFPVFENNYRQLQEISHTLNEKKEIAKYTNGTYLTSKNALKKTFLSDANKYDILHLSTHASAGNFHKPAHIEFRNETLYLPEIYGLHLNADLTVLSACETGIGKLQKGEGAMSLARGFLYAGIKNLLVSLWKVNDKATSILMRNFYKNYKKTNTKSAAIHQAKLDYLNDKSISNTKKTPFYWASFVFIGNTEVAINKSFEWQYIGLGTMLLLGFIYLRKRVRQ